MFVWKEHFSAFCKFLCEEFETISWKSYGKHSKLFKSTFGHRKVLRKWFWGYLEIKNQCCKRLKRSLFSFLKEFWVTKLKSFCGKVRQNVQDCLNQNFVIGSLLENGFEATLSGKMNVLSVWKEHFSVFCKFFIEEVETIFW